MNDINAIFRRLRDLDERLVVAGINSHDRVHMLVNACITEGINTGSRIVGTLARLDYNRRHVGIILKEGVRADPGWTNWARNAEGTYSAPARVLPTV